MNKAYIFLGVFLVFIALMGYVLIKNSVGQGISISSDQNISYPYGSAFSHYQGKVYYNKPFRGYFEVKGADINTFAPLGDNTLLAKDKNHVYYKTEVIPGIDPVTVVHLGTDYCKDTRQIFYGKTPLTKAEVASFRFVNGFYAADKNHIYYKQFILKAGDPSTLHGVGTTTDTDYRHHSDYLKDKAHVYYKGSVIDQANAANFTCLDMENGPTSIYFAFDSTHYFYESRPVLVDHDVIRSRHLKLLSTDLGFSWNALFYNDNEVYAYDLEKKELVQMGLRDNPSPMIQVDKGVFKDDKHVYFSYYHTGSETNTVGLALVKNADPNDFKTLGSFEGPHSPAGTIYQSHGQKYFHANEAGNFSARGLFLFQADGTVEDLPNAPGFSAQVANGKVPNGSWKDIKSIFKRDTDYNDN
jgi:hypothetical protein